MEAQVTKLAAALSKEEVAAFAVPQGHHVVTIHYNTDQKTGVKRESESWIVPKLDAGVLSDSSVVLGAIAKWVDSLQSDALREVADGDLDYVPMVSSVEKLLEDYGTDRRGERKGPKQSQLVEWIKSVLVPYLVARIDRNMPTASKEQKQNLIVSFSGKFGIAATRSNRRGNETLPEATLVDLLKRLEQYSEPGEFELPQSMERDAIIARIKDHISALQKAAADITVADF